MTLTLVAGRLAGAVAALAALGQIALALIDTDARHLATPIAGALLCAGSLVLMLAARWWWAGLPVGVLGSAALALKPAIFPYVSEWSGRSHVLSYTAESHLYWVVPGLLLLGASVVVGAVSLVPLSIVGLDGESTGKNLLSAVGIGLVALGMGAVSCLAFLGGRATALGAATELLPGLVLAALGLVAFAHGIPSSFRDAPGPAEAKALVGFAPTADARQFLSTELPSPGFSPSSPPAAVPGRLGHFELIDALGEGGMGRVFRARDTRLLRDVAVKLLAPELAHDATRRERLLREAQAAARIAHPNVLSIFEIEASGAHPYIVMELVPGETLRERVARGPLPTREALEVCEKIASGLAAAHAQGVVHRDLKPDNVAVGHDGQVKILDFGIARFDQQADFATGATLLDAPMLTREGQVIGTPAYMSPEQALGASVDARSDVFSFGTLLFELCTGRQAFLRRTSEETRAAVAQALLPADGWEAALPPAVVALIRRATAREPEARPRDGAELAREVAAARAALG